MDRKKFLKSTAASALGYTGLAMGGGLSTGLAVNLKDVPSRPSDLRITDIRGVTIAANYDYNIIKIYTNQGITGLGEVRDAGRIGQALIAKPYLIGKDPLDIKSILDSIWHINGHGRYGGGYSAIDIALMDIAGKALGWPCWKLLSDEKERDEVEVYADTFGSENLEANQRFMQQRLDAGFRHYKMDLRPWYLEDTPGAQVQMGSGNSPWQRLPTEKGLEIWGEYVQNVRDVIGYDVVLGADHFGFLNTEMGIRLGEFMADSKYSLAYIEDVVNYNRYNAVGINKDITDGSPTPTLGFEDIGWGLEGYKPFIENHTIKMIHPDPLTSGGMIETKKIADYAYQFGIDTMLHYAGSPVGSMASVHLASTLRNFVSLENHALEMPWWPDLITGYDGPIIDNGVTRVPDGPGLGIELNEEVARKHQRESEYLPYDPGFFDPTPEFDQPISMREAQEKDLIGGWDTSIMGPWWHVGEDGEYRYFEEVR